MEELRVAVSRGEVERILMDNVSPAELKVFVNWGSRAEALGGFGRDQ